MRPCYDTLETRDLAEREGVLMAALSRCVARARQVHAHPVAVAAWGVWPRTLWAAGFCAVDLVPPATLPNDGRLIEEARTYG